MKKSSNDTMELQLPKTEGMTLQDFDGDTQTYTFERVDVVRNPIKRDENGLISEFERIKTVKKEVKITMKEALVLNQGMMTCLDNSRFEIYLLPGQPLPFVRQKNNDKKTEPFEVVYR